MSSIAPTLANRDSVLASSTYNNTSVFSTVNSLLGLQNKSGSQIAFVDSGLDNADELMASLTGAVVYEIGTEDGVSFITDVLARHQAQAEVDGTVIGAVHILAHGDRGTLQLGTTTLDADSLNGYADELAIWGDSQTNDVLLYGCNVADGDIGRTFVEQLATFTSADIQASNDLTGSAVFGGNWDLEVATGEIETSVVISPVGQATYQGTLALAIAGSTALDIDENATFVTDLNLTGVQGGFTEGNGVEYYLHGGQDSYLFNLNVNTGELAFLDAPDFENAADANRDNVYDVGVRAIDYSGQLLDQLLRVTVQDVSENQSGLAIAGSTALDVNAGSTLVTDLNVTGVQGGFTEGNGVEYYLHGGQDSYLFNLNVDTGELSFIDAPEFENPADADRDNVYDVGVRAIDYSGQLLDQSLTVTVQAGPESPVITSNGGTDSAVIEVDEQTTAITDVNATAANGASEGNGFVYSINEGADADLLNIDPTTGIISFKAPTDFENPSDADGNNVYFANIVVQDPTGAADSQFLSIVVKNVDEEGSEPVITSNGGADSAFVRVPENTTAAVDMAVTDVDGDTEGNGISYLINDGEDRDLFNIDADTGVISFKAAPDFETPLDSDGDNIYRINVLAVDSTGQADSQFIQIEVTNMVSLYLLGGQSNMAGDTSDAAFLAGTPQGAPLPEVQIWQPGFQSFEALRPGFNSNFGNGGGFGAEIGFGHAMAAAQASGTLDSEEIYIVKYAIGATTLAEDWNPDGSGAQYNAFNNWVGGALDNLTNANIGFEIEAMLWMQGENDAIEQSRADNYQANLTNFISDIRSRYGADMDFLIGRLHEELTPNFYTYAPTVREAQVAVANSAANNYWIDTDDLVVNPVDGVHFDSSGHLALGEAFADVLIG